MEPEQELSKILLIDDNPNDRLLAVRELKREFPQITIREAVDWSGIEQAFDDDDFDFVVTDYELNWATGLDVLRSVKSHDPMRPIIMFTNSGTQEIAVEAMKAGLDDYVIKSPKHFMRLRQAVRSVWKNAQIRRKARELEFRLRFLLNELNVGVFRSTLDGQLIEASDGLLDLLSVQSFSDAQQFFRQHLALSQAERGDQQQWHREIRVDGVGDRPCWLQISETRVTFNGKTLIDGLITDITEQRETAEELRSLNQTLEERVHQRTARLELLNKELEMFAFSVSHDLRAPIRQIDGFVELLLQRLEPTNIDDTTRHYLDVLNELTDRSGHLIDDLLQFSRTGRAEMKYTPVNMDQLIREVRRQLEPQINDRTIDWQIDSLLEVKGDRNLLRQVWQNLIGNAVKYTRSRDRAKITIGSTRENGETIFFISDNGIGFDQNDAQYLFGVFQRLPNAEEFEGTGIGLANVKRILYRHKGRIWAEGKINEGATFYFAIPSREDEP
ncbi:MAG: ATP-binding protein [Leptolyngbyaceae bacterium]|nr:ATP-binding protein [Leptolyngbyaceae bacterium]